MPENKTFINRYNVIHKLGEGGMGTVWKVFDEIEKKEVALKEIKFKELGSKLPVGSFISLTSSVTKSSEAELRFSEEFRTMTKLQYPYTVKVYDYGILNSGNKYITMEIVEGENLRQILEKRKLDYAAIYKILIQLTQTLNFIHSRLYVHRDIKSENIIITKQGDIKLMDFGLMDRMGIQSTGKLTGTIQYMPPEVPKGGVIDARSDLYSIGCFAYELVAGQTPFIGTTAVDVIKQHVNVVPKKLTLIREDIPFELETIIYKLLEKDQSNRYQTCTDLIQDLQRLSDVELVEESLEQRKSYLLCSEIIGRQENINKLQKALEVVKNKKGKSLFIGAPAGVGKTRLINEFKLTAQLSDLPFLECPCVEQGMEPFHPLKEIFKKIISFTPKEVLDKYGNILVKLLPQLARKGFKPASNLDGDSEKIRLLDTVSNWLKEVSLHKSFILCIDDIHWIDASSLELLNVCIRALKDSPVMILCAFRDDEVEEGSPIFFTIDEDLSEFEKLSPLTKEDVGILIRTMLGDVDFPDEFDQYLFSVTGGNAFFVTETMRSLIEEDKLRIHGGRWKFVDLIDNLNIPTSIEDTLNRRLNLLSDAAFHMAQIASVFGKELDLLIIKKVSNIQTEEIFKALDELIEKQFLLKEGQKYVFTHDRVRETLYSQIEESEKEEIHQKIGETCEEKYSKNLKEGVSLLAYHYYRGKDLQKAAKYLILSADQLYQASILADCAQTYKIALQILERIEYPEKERIMFEIRYRVCQFAFYSDIELTIESVAKLKQHIYNMVGGEQKLLNLIKFMRVAYKAINLLPRGMAIKIKGFLGHEHDHPPAPKNFLQKILQKIPDLQFIVPKIIVSTVFEGTSYMFKGQYQKNLEIYDYVVDNYLPEKNSFIEGTICPGRGATLSYLGMYETMLNDARQGIKYLEECTDKYKVDLERLQWTMFGYCYMFDLLWNGCQGMPVNEENYKKAFKIYQDHKDAGVYGWIINAKNYSLTLRGRHKEFEQTMQEAEDLNKKLGRPMEMYKWNTLFKCYNYLNKGKWDLLEKQINKGWMIVTKMGVRESMEGSFVGYIEGRMLFEQGNIDEAEKIWERTVGFSRMIGLNSLPLILCGLFDIYMKKGQIEKAREVADEAHTFVVSKIYNCPHRFCNTARIKGRLALYDKDYESSKAYLEKSLAIGKEYDIIIEQGFTYMALAELYAELQQQIKTEETLEQAMVVFNEVENEYQLKKSQILKKELSSEFN